jgi:hypothetical protein
VTYAPFVIDLTGIVFERTVRVDDGLDGGLLPGFAVRTTQLAVADDGRDENDEHDGQSDECALHGDTLINPGRAW